MISRDAFAQEFESLLEKLPKEYSFRQAQFAYREVALLMAIKLLQNYPEVLIGRQPGPKDLTTREAGGPRMAPPPPGAGNGGVGVPDGGPGIGPNPHELCSLICQLLNA